MVNIKRLAFFHRNVYWVWVIYFFGAILAFSISANLFLYFRNCQLQKQLNDRGLNFDSVPNTAPSVNVFLECISKVFPFKGLNDELKKIVVCNKSDVFFENEIYFTDAFFNPSTALKIAEIEARTLSRVYLTPAPVEGKLILSIEHESMGGEKDFILVDSEGRLIKESIIKSNYDKIGLGTVIRGQYGITSAGFLADKKATFSVNFLNDDGLYAIKINGLTGEYIEDSREKIR